MSHNLPRINISKRLWGFGLIVPYPSGVLYTVPTSGASFDIKSIEGVLVPLHDHRKPDPQEDLWRIFGMTNDKESIADLVDDLLEKSTGIINGIVVDRDRLDEMFEAWVPVLIGSIDRDPIFEGEGFAPTEGILTWQNSD